MNLIQHHRQPIALKVVAGRDSVEAPGKLRPARVGESGHIALAQGVGERTGGVFIRWKSGNKGKKALDLGLSGGVVAEQRRKLAHTSILVAVDRRSKSRRPPQERREQGDHERRARVLDPCEHAMTGNTSHSLLRSASALLSIASVPVLVIVLVRWCFGVPITAFRPVMFDEISYWHETLTFSTVGFGGGYYTWGELTNAAGVTPFGSHGPGFPIVYGLVGKLFGWYRHSQVVLNLAAIALAVWGWTTASKLPLSRMLLAGALLITFWPMLLWAPTGMQEALHHAGAIAMAAFFAYAFAPAPRPWVTAIGWIVLASLSFIRPTWLVLMPLWAFATAHAKGRRAIAISVGASLLLTIVVFVLYSRTTAPFPTGFFFLRVLDRAEGIDRIWGNLRFNLLRTIEPGEYKFDEVLFRVQYWLWLAAAAALTIVWLRSRTADRRASALLGIGTIAMAVALSLMLVLYTLTNWAEHRVLSAFLLFAALLCAAVPGRPAALLVAALIASNLATAKPFLDSFRGERSDNFVWDRRGAYELADAIDGHIVYRPGATRWCNTLLTSQYPPQLIVVPAGIGLSTAREPNEMTGPPRSHFLFLDDAARADFRVPIHIQPLATLAYGTLYLNLDSGCQ